MECYIQVGELRKELSEAEARALLAQVNAPKRTLADAAVGEVVRIGAREFLVLEQQDGQTAVILKNLLLEDVIFGKNNCYRDSRVAEICDQFADEMEAEVGAENLCAFEVDLTSDDGLKDYGSVECRAALLTADRYRKWVEVLDTCRVKSGGGWPRLSAQNGMKMIGGLNASRRRAHLQRLLRQRHRRRAPVLYF